MPEYTRLQRLALGFEKPLTMGLGILGFLLIFYGSWMQNLNIALLGLIVFILAKLNAYYTSGRAKAPKKLSSFQMFLVGHTYPINYIFHLAGHIIIFYGAWLRSLGLILLGVIPLLAGDTYAKLKQRKVF